jgi:hypothetical protein
MLPPGIAEACLFYYFLRTKQCLWFISTYLYDNQHMVKSGCKSHSLSATKAQRHKADVQPGKKAKHELVNGIFVAKYPSLLIDAKLIYGHPSLTYINF